MSAVRVCGSMLSTRPSRIAPSQVRRARRDLSMRADPLKMPDKFSTIDPKGDYLLVKVAEQEDVTPGGILIPSASLRRPTTGEVVAVGDGNMPDSVTWKFKVEKGDAVLYSKFGFMFTEVELKGELFIIVREADIIAKMPNAPARAEDVPDMTPMSDRVLIKIDEVSDISSGGVMLPESAKDRPLSGTVVKVGPGKQEKDGSVTPVKVNEGDQVLYFKYAGDNMETPDGTQYVVVHASDILCKA